MEKGIKVIGVLVIGVVCYAFVWMGLCKVSGGTNPGLSRNEAYKNAKEYVDDGFSKEQIECIARDYENGIFIENYYDAIIEPSDFEEARQEYLDRLDEECLGFKYGDIEALNNGLNTGLIVIAVIGAMVAVASFGFMI